MPETIGLLSLGCAKNRVDSEQMLGLLRNAGYTLTNDPAQADILIVNTCGFIQSAKEEAIQTLLEMAEFKQKGCCRLLVATGCLVQRYGEELREQMPEIDVVFPLINKAGMGILGGGLPEMLKSIQLVYESGKGLYGMKALAGGHLVEDMLDAIAFVRDIPGMQSVSIGVTSIEEANLQFRIFNGEKIDPASLGGLKAKKQIKVMDFLCKSCGACVKACPNNALAFDGKIPAADPRKCVLCGYCTPVCPEFAIRLK